MFSLPQLDAVQIVGGLILVASAAFAARQRGWLKLPTFSTTAPAPVEAEVQDADALSAAFTVAKYAAGQKQYDLQQAAANLAKQILEPRGDVGPQPSTQEPEPK